MTEGKENKNALIPGLDDVTSLVVIIVGGLAVARLWPEYVRPWLHSIVEQITGKPVGGEEVAFGFSAVDLVGIGAVVVVIAGIALLVRSSLRQRKREREEDGGAR